ncbi:hypothetical protein D5S17_32845 [Pseudonocardiaceae bacterium YIM PH 21723]|nr:hypothetical protein D5S17_32845 [Pseudonocardiaceae bacterium YIM PH 21723]
MTGGLTTEQAAELVRAEYGYCTAHMVRNWIHRGQLTRNPNGLIDPAALLRCDGIRKRIARRPRKVDG